MKTANSAKNTARSYNAALSRREVALLARWERERRLLAALGEGRRTVAQLLDAAWSDVPAELRPVAAVTLAAHLDKLEEEQLLPAGVERPQMQGWER